MNQQYGIAFNEYSEVIKGLRITEEFSIEEKGKVAIIHFGIHKKILPQHLFSEIKKMVTEEMTRSANRFKYINGVSTPSYNLKLINTNMDYDAFFDRYWNNLSPAD